MEKKYLSGILEEMTVGDLKKLNPTLGIIPIGSTEPHGLALPYGTDSFAVEATSYKATKLANSQGGRVICLPTQKISLNNNFYGLPFACKISVPTFMSMVKEVVTFLMEEGIKKIIIINGHGGNIDVLKAVQRDMSGVKGLFLGLITSAVSLPKSCEHLAELIENPVPKGEEHAGEWETSMMLYLKPELVKKEKISSNPVNRPKTKLLDDCNVHYVKPWHLFLPNSAGGDARKSNAEKAQKIFEASVKVWAELFVELSLASPSETFPFE